MVMQYGRIYKKYTDDLFKKAGVKKCIFSSINSRKFITKRKRSCRRFCTEVAMVTEAEEKPLEEKLIVRPTSETMLSTLYSKWISSWRDLPLVYKSMV